jgi:hypothetical protein
VADLASEVVADLCVPRHGLCGASGGIGPQRMGGTFTFEDTPMTPQVQQEGAALHVRTTVSLSASGGTARRPSVRRSSKINAIACRRLSRASSLVCPCPLAPGISGQYAMVQAPSRSNTAVNSLCIVAPQPNDSAVRPTLSNRLSGASCGFTARLAAFETQCRIRMGGRTREWNRRDAES